MTLAFLLSLSTLVALIATGATTTAPLLPTKQEQTHSVHKSTPATIALNTHNKKINPHHDHNTPPTQQQQQLRVPSGKHTSEDSSTNHPLLEGTIPIGGTKSIDPHHGTKGGSKIGSSKIGGTIPSNTTGELPKRLIITSNAVHALKSPAFRTGSADAVRMRFDLVADPSQKNDVIPWVPGPDSLGMTPVDYVDQAGPLGPNGPLGALGPLGDTGPLVNRLYGQEPPSKQLTYENMWCATTPDQDDRQDRHAPSSARRSPTRHSKKYHALLAQKKTVLKTQQRFGATSSALSTTTTTSARGIAASRSYSTNAASPSSSAAHVKQHSFPTVPNLKLSDTVSWMFDLGFHAGNSETRRKSSGAPRRRETTKTNMMVHNKSDDECVYGSQGPLGEAGPLSEDAYYDTMYHMNDTMAWHGDYCVNLDASGVWGTQGPLGVTGALGALGPLGPLGITPQPGVNTTSDGAYMYGGSVIRKTSPIRFNEEASLWRVYNLFEVYGVSYAQELGLANDCSFGVQALEDPPERGDSFYFTSDVDQFVSVNVVPCHYLNHYGLEAWIVKTAGNNRTETNTTSASAYRNHNLNTSGENKKKNNNDAAMAGNKQPIGENKKNNAAVNEMNATFDMASPEYRHPSSPTAGKYGEEIFLAIANSDPFKMKGTGISNFMTFRARAGESFRVRVGQMENGGSMVDPGYWFYVTGSGFSEGPTREGPFAPSSVFGPRLQKDGQRRFNIEGPHQRWAPWM